MSEKREEKGDRSKPRLSIHHGEKKKQTMDTIHTQERKRKEASLSCHSPSNFDRSKTINPK